MLQAQDLGHPQTRSWGVNLSEETLRALSAGYDPGHEGYR